MTLSTAQPRDPTTALDPREIVQATLRFAGSLYAIDTVTRVAVSWDGSALELWVLMREEILSDAERIHLLEWEFRRAIGPAPVSVHVLPLSEIDPETLPDAETVFQR